MQGHPIRLMNGKKFSAKATFIDLFTGIENQIVTSLLLL